MKQATRPNIIFVLADDLGYGELGCFGQKMIATPHLDRMAAEGMRFTRFYAGSPVCAPSRSVLMTGLHTGHTRVRGNAGGQARRMAQVIRAEDPTFAETLKKAGYATALIGKWGLAEEGTDGIPNRKGFDYFYGYLNQSHAHNPYPEFLLRNEKRVRLRNRLDPQARERLPNLPRNGAGWAVEKKDFAPDRMADEALKWVEQNRSHPFLLYWSLITPHANNEATRGTGDGQEVPDYGSYADKPWPNPDKGHAAVISRLDADMGRLFDLLKRLNLDDRTLVLFSSDNGHHREGANNPDLFDANGPLRGMKRELYEGGIRVPTIARWPGKIKPGTVSGHVACFTDLFPTFAELAGAPVPAGLDGLSLVPVLTGQGTPTAHKTLYWEFHEAGFTQAVLMDGRYKAVRRKRRDAPTEIYDLATDEAETHDLAAVRPELVFRAERLFVTERRENPDWPIRDAPPDAEKTTPAPRPGAA
jgi:arylsulfatase A-like enzyme